MKKIMTFLFAASTLLFLASCCCSKGDLYSTEKLKQIAPAAARASLIGSWSLKDEKGKNTGVKMVFAKDGTMVTILPPKGEKRKGTWKLEGDHIILYSGKTPTVKLSGAGDGNASMYFVWKGGKYSKKPLTIFLIREK